MISESIQRSIKAADMSIILYLAVEVCERYYLIYNDYMKLIGDPDRLITEHEKIAAIQGYILKRLKEIDG